MTSRWRRARMVVAAAAVGSLLIGGAAAMAAPGGNGWSSAGGNRENTRYAASESKISPSTAPNLSTKWELTTGGDVSATPAVDGQRVYVPDWAGNLYAVNRSTGVVVWQRTITSYTGIPGDKARATPAVTDTAIVIGTQGPFGGGGKVLAINKDTGDLLWSTQADSNPGAIITQSATVFDGVVYVGVASQEEAYAAFVEGYPCCTFRGSMLALDLATGTILWKTYMTPEGSPGVAVWGSSPAIDMKRGSVYIATGNNYDMPDDILACVKAQEGNPAGQAACVPPDDHFDSILALDMRTGAIKWATRALPFDAWTVDCIPLVGDGSNCPEPAGPDYDFGQAPALFTVKVNGKPQDLVGAGQKSGQYWALDAATGEVVWTTQAGPGGTAGGLQWGSAVDGRRVYTQNANSNFKPWPAGGADTSGVWSGLDAATGEVLWETRPPDGGSTSGPVTTANGVVFGCSLDAAGHMYALDASTGEVLWSFASGGSCLSGAAISNGTVFWGSGYSNFNFGTPNNKLYAFGLS
jgi:polyvinyl alcohol dehydrogenase (cytochrome)